MNVSIVILAWNASAMTKQCLDTLRPTLKNGDQVIVVDNGSTDDTAQILDTYDWIDRVNCVKNYGFAGGNNRGAALAKNDIIIFLNNDTKITRPDWLEELTLPIETGYAIASGPGSNYVSGIQETLGPDDLLGLDVRATWFDTTRLVGFCLAVKKDVYEAVGGWDEQFKTGGYEDDDLCLRLGRYGKLVFASRSWVYHYGHATFDANKLDWWAEQENNRLIFERKWS